MMKPLLKLSTWLSHVALAVAGIALLAMMGITVLDIILRYAFKLSAGASGVTLTGGVELVEYLLLAMILAAMAAHVERSQVIVEVFTQKLSEKLQARIAALCLLIFALIGATVAFGIGEAASSAAEFGEITQDLAMPKAPIYAVASALFVIFTLRSAIHGLHDLLEGTRHDT